MQTKANNHLVFLDGPHWKFSLIPSAYAARTDTALYPCFASVKRIPFLSINMNMHTPEIILSQYQQRLATKRTVLRSKKWSRGLELTRWLGVGLFVAVWLWRKEELAAALLAILFVSFAIESLRKRWSLEDRVAELERPNILNRARRPII